MSGIFVELVELFGPYKERFFKIKKEETGDIKKEETTNSNAPKIKKEQP